MTEPPNSENAIEWHGFLDPLAIVKLPRPADPPLSSFVNVLGRVRCARGLRDEDVELRYVDLGDCKGVKLWITKRLGNEINIPTYPNPGPKIISFPFPPITNSAQYIELENTVRAYMKSFLLKQHQLLTALPQHSKLLSCGLTLFLVPPPSVSFKYDGGPVSVQYFYIPRTWMTLRRWKSQEKNPCQSKPTNK
ncbi:hypothetical protein FRB91_001932 [Serendipita sp. 411]|nr:hypothetical protein FRB91_001932 [Serendipita sp. 411]